MRMKILLICRRCGYEEQSTSEKTFIKKVIMWDHVKKAHPGMAERLMRTYAVLLNDFFHIESSGHAAHMLFNASVLREV